ncbi:MAG TPA: hypothetical protein VFD36_20630 [Kofleriaceae bacterium]|nr:hypothetical protein [Kofleriaceae bacterium]
MKRDPVMTQLAVQLLLNTIDPVPEMPRINPDGTCPDAGQCHGPVRWCEVCGDVDEICGGPVCHQHRCLACNNIFTFAEREYNYTAERDVTGHCFACKIRRAMRKAQDSEKPEIQALDEKWGAEEEDMIRRFCQKHGLVMWPRAGDP